MVYLSEPFVQLPDAVLDAKCVKETYNQAKKSSRD